MSCYDGKKSNWYTAPPHKEALGILVPGLGFVKTQSRSKNPVRASKNAIKTQPANGNLLPMSCYDGFWWNCYPVPRYKKALAFPVMEYVRGSVLTKPGPNPYQK